MSTPDESAGEGPLDEERLRRFFAGDGLDTREQAALASVSDAVAARDFAGSGAPRGGRVVALAGGVSMMVASGAVAVVVLRQHGSAVATPSGPSPAPAPSTANLPPERGDLVNPQLNAVKMVGALDGWGWNERKVFRTLDGGSSWTAVTPPAGIGADTPILSFDAVDADHAWVVISEGPAGSLPSDAMVWRTLDGGKIWEGISAPRGNGHITMLSTTAGFIFTGESGAAGSEAVAIVRTDGANWTLMSETPADAASAAAGAPGVPFSCAKTGAGFVNGYTGWVAGSCGDAAALFLVTHDGGVHWKPQTLAAPPHMKVVSAQPPVFLADDSLEGYLVARAIDATTSLTQEVPVLYRTHDGGSTWSAQRAAPAGCTDAVAIDAGTAVCVSGNGTVYRLDAGGSWTALATHPELANASVALMFLRGPQSPGAGFGYVFAIPPSSTTGQGVLYRTTDSGRTLTRVSG